MNTVIPKKPTYIMPTHFRYSGDVNVAIQIINELLQKDSNLSSDFTGAKWNITFINTKSGALTKCEINIFRDNDVYIFEGNRLNRDETCSFQNLFNRISNAVIGTALREDVSFAPLPLPEDIEIHLSEEEALDAIRPILDLASSEDGYSRNMGLQVLCEILSEENHMRQYFAKLNCIPLLVNAIYTNNSRLSAIIGLTHLTDNAECIQVIRDAMHTPVRFDNGSDDRIIKPKYDNLIRILYPEQCAEMSM